MSDKSPASSPSKLRFDTPTHSSALPNWIGHRASNTSSATEGLRLEVCPINPQTLVARIFVRSVLHGRSECHAAFSWIEIKPFLSPDSTIESRSADVAVRTQQVQSSV